MRAPEGRLPARSRREPQRACPLRVRQASQISAVHARVAVVAVHVRVGHHPNLIKERWDVIPDAVDHPGVLATIVAERRVASRCGRDRSKTRAARWRGSRLWPHEKKRPLGKQYGPLWTEKRIGV